MFEENFVERVSRAARDIQNTVLQIMNAVRRLLEEGPGSAFVHFKSWVYESMNLSNHLRSLANILNRRLTKVREVKLFGSALGLVGGAVAGIGAILAIPTGGLTLPLAGAGLVVAGTGGVIAFIASVAEFIIKVVNALAGLQTFFASVETKLIELFVVEGFGIKYVLCKGVAMSAKGGEIWEKVDAAGNSGYGKAAKTLWREGFCTIPEWGPGLFAATFLAIVKSYFDFVTTARKIRDQDDLSAFSRGLVNIAEKIDFLPERF